MSPNKTKKLVLVVDDEPMDINNIRNVLEETQEFSIFSATNYDEAVSAFEQRGGAIDLALIDVALPGKNGVELAKHLLITKPDLRVIFVSGHVGASVIRFYGINATDEHFVQKPFDGSTLLRKIRGAFASNRPLQLILSASSSGSTEDETSGSGD
jgi:two-component system, cell cycle sensor histidine kinase and response regulator CckA